MNRRTFEILAKYIGKKHGITVHFDVEGGPPHANMKDKSIHLPFDIGKEHVFAALALLMHEAAHVAHSTKIPIKQVCRDQLDQSILNVMEDIRIDRKNMYLLPNIPEFYHILVEKYVKPLEPKAPFQTKVLVNCILEMEGFSGYQDQQIKGFIQHHNLKRIIDGGIDNIEYDRWPDVSKTIQDIRAILYPNEPIGPPPIEIGLAQGDGQGNGQAGQGKVLVQSKGGQGQQMQGTAPGGGTDNNKYNGIEVIMRPAKVWDKGESMTGASGDQVGGVALEEITKQKFKEILNIKERTEISNGMKLDTENLISFFTGELEELFKEEKIVRTKKSKILFLLDASGSMGAPLLDNHRRVTVVTKCCKTLTSILQEVIETEGINVDYEVAGFEHCYIEYDRNNWWNEYRAGGGTNLDNAFAEALERMRKDYTIEGKKIVIVFSDGDVSNDQIRNVKQQIVQAGEDIRCLIIGVGSDPTGALATEVIGDNLILAQENANNVIMDTIEQAL